MEGLTPVARNIEAVRRFYAAGPAADDTTRAPLVSPDIVWHVPGDNPVSGEYRGVAEVFGTMLSRMGPLATWEMQVVDVMGNSNYVVATVHLIGERRGVHIDSNAVHAYRLDHDGRIVEAWGFVADQAALDDFFRA